MLAGDVLKNKTLLNKGMIDFLKGVKNKEEIYKLKKELEDTDYKVIKCAEYQLAGLDMPYDVVELNTARQAIRDKINELGG